MVYVLITVLLLLDLFTKGVAEATIKHGTTIPVIPDWLSWKVIHNSGASFGLLASHPYFILAGSIATISLIFYLYVKSDTKGFAMKAGFALIVSGAVGNLVNRAEFGYVTDFIQFRWWPAIFNVADIEIRAGTIMFLILFVSNRWKLPFGKSRDSCGWQK